MGNEALEQLKAKYAQTEIDDDSDGDDGLDGGDDDLDDDFGGETADEGGEESEGDGSEPEQTGTDPQKRGSDEEASLLSGEKMVKLNNGEWISKKSFIKRLKGETEKRRSIEERVKKYDDKKDFYGRWEQYAPQFEQAAKFTEQLRPVLQQQPWLQEFLSSAIEGKATNWQNLAIALKPMLAPFWDGAPEVVKADPQSLVMQQQRQLQERLEKFEKAQQTQQQEIQSRELQQRHQQSFAQMEQSVWKRWPNHANNQMLRNMIYDRAEVIQSQLPNGQIVDLNKVAAEIVGQYENDRKGLAVRARGAQQRARRAAGERGSGLPGPLTPSDPTAAPKNLRESVRTSVLGRFGLRGKSSLE